MEPKTARQTEPPWRLALAAIGGPPQVAGKLRRLLRTVRLYLHPAEVDRRLRELARKGFVEGPAPTRLQIAFGGLDMLRFVIEPAARDYYAQRGISFGFHQLLRVIDDPVSMVDPTGLLSERDTIIGHVLQVVHLNPVYDMQLLQMFPDGLDEMERQAAAMVAGTHPRAGTIGAVVEDAAYHARLLDYVRRWRVDPRVPDLVREEQTIRTDAHFAAAERHFAALPGFLAYCRRLPRDLPGLVRRLRTVKRFPLDYSTASMTSDP